MLLVGKHDQEVADAIGVHRVTVTRWRLYHPQFQATLNERRAAAWQASKDAYLDLLPKAVEVLRAELEQAGPQRVKIALALLRSSPLPHADFDHPGPTDPDGVVEEVAKQESARRLEKMDTLLVDDADRRAIFEDLLGKANEPPPDDPRPDRATGKGAPRRRAARK